MSNSLISTIKTNIVTRDSIIAWWWVSISSSYLRYLLYIHAHHKRHAWACIMWASFSGFFQHGYFLDLPAIETHIKGHTFLPRVRIIHKSILSLQLKDDSGLKPVRAQFVFLLVPHIVSEQQGDFHLSRPITSIYWMRSKSSLANNAPHISS